MERCCSEDIGARHVATGEESDADGANQGNAEEDAMVSGVHAADGGGGGVDAIDDDAARRRRRLDASPTSRRRRRMETA